MNENGVNINYWFDLFIAVFGSVLASSGLWAFLQARRAKKDNKTKLLLGLAYDRILHLGKVYIDRGWVTYDEYEDFIKYLYVPYTSFGGNGVAERIKNELGKLPMRRNSIILEKDKDNG